MKPTQSRTQVAIKAANYGRAAAAAAVMFRPSPGEPVVTSRLYWRTTSPLLCDAEAQFGKMRILSKMRHLGLSSMPQDKARLL